MKLFKRYKLEILAFIPFVFVYFLTRLYNITSLPLFTDEAIYTRWSQIARYDAAWRFISLTDGKQPSFVWLDMLFMKLINDPLLAGRLVSVFAGLLGLVGIYFLGSELFKNRKIGVISSFLYLIFPYSLVYDRMALYDSLVAAISIWALYFEILLIRKKRLDLALILGMVLGAGVLTKSSAFFSIYLMPFLLLIYNFRDKKWKESLFKTAILFGVSIIFAYGCYSLLRLSPFYHIINEKNGIFVYSFSEWKDHPFRFFQGNLSGLFNWLYVYSTIPTVVLMFGAFLIGGVRQLKEKALLFIWFFLPFAALALFGKVLYPRHILFMVMPLLVMAAFTLNFLLGKIKNVPAKVFILFILAFLMLRSDYMIITDFARAPIPFSDKEQYINGWPAGGGVKEIVSLVDNESKKGKVYVATEGTFGSLPTYAMEIYLGDNRNVEKRGIWPVPDKIPFDLQEKAEKMPVYFIFNQTQTPPLGWPITLVNKYKKGVSSSYMSVYRVLPK